MFMQNALMSACACAFSAHGPVGIPTGSSGARLAASRRRSARSSCRQRGEAWACTQRKVRPQLRRACGARRAVTRPKLLAQRAPGGRCAGRHGRRRGGGRRGGGRRGSGRRGSACGGVRNGAKRGQRQRSTQRARPRLRLRTRAAAGGRRVQHSRCVRGARRCTGGRQQRRQRQRLCGASTLRCPSPERAQQP
jgi:hypothetical protein